MLLMELRYSSAIFPNEQKKRCISHTETEKLMIQQYCLRSDVFAVAVAGDLIGGSPVAAATVVAAVLVVVLAVLVVVAAAAS